MELEQSNYYICKIPHIGKKSKHIFFFLSL